MAVELKDAVGRYELLEKESQAKAADLEKTMVAAKETRSKIKAVKEELRQAARSQARCRHLPHQAATSVRQTHQSGKSPDPQPPAHESGMIITWDYDPLFAAFRRQPESQGLLSA